MLFINTTESIGLIITSGTNTVTGNIIATLFLVMVFLFAVCILFQIPLEFSAIIMLPYIIMVAAFYSTLFYGCLIFLILYVGILITKNFLFR